MGRDVVEVGENAGREVGEEGEGKQWREGWGEVGRVMVVEERVGEKV